SSCSYFFTNQQATYMMNILTGVRGSLLNSTACDNVNAPPFAYFTNNQPEQITIEHGEYLQFTDLSTNNPTSWFWDFGGGALNATVQNPLVQFTELGEFTVKLVASNVFGADSIIKTLLVDVNYAPLSISGVSSPS